MSRFAEPPRSSPLVVRAGRRVGSIVGWVGIPLVVIFFAAIFVHGIGPAVVSARGGGVPGTFTAEQHTCTRDRYGTACSWTGTFVGDDGTRLVGVEVRGAPPDGQLPTTLRLVWDGSRDPVNLRPPGRDALPLVVITILTLLSTVIGVAWAVALERTVRRRPWPGWVSALRDLAHWR